VAVFVAGSAATWIAGISLSKSTDSLDRRFGLGEELGGLVLAGRLRVLHPRPPADRLEAGDGLEAPARTARARLTVRADGHVPELAGEPARAAVELAVDHDPRADADLPRHVDERLQVERDAVPELGQRRQVGLVADGHDAGRQAEPRLQLRADRDLRPAEVRRA